MKNKIVPVPHTQNDIKDYIHRLKCMNKTKGKGKNTRKKTVVSVFL